MIEACVLLQATELLSYNEKSLKMSLVYEPQKRDADIILKNLTVNSQKSVKAIEYLRKAVMFRINDPNIDDEAKSCVVYFMALCLEKTHFYKKCITYLNMAISLNPNHVGANMHLANLLVNLKQDKQSECSNIYTIQSPSELTSS